jgi:hypothetical protein
MNLREQKTPINKYQFTTLVSGNESFYEHVGIPLAGALESCLPDEGISQVGANMDSALSLNRQITASASLIVGTVGVLLFVAGSISKDLLHDIYIAKIQPAVNKILNSADKKLEGENAKGEKAFEVGFWYSEERVIILIAIFGDSFKEILKYHDMVKDIHRNGVSWIQRNGRQKTVHLYKVESGKVNLEPYLFDTLAEAKIRGIGK